MVVGKRWSDKAEKACYNAKKGKYITSKFQCCFVLYHKERVFFLCILCNCKYTIGTRWSLNGSRFSWLLVSTASETDRGQSWQEMQYQGDWQRLQPGLWLYGKAGSGRDRKGMKQENNAREVGHPSLSQRPPPEAWAGVVAGQPWVLGENGTKWYQGRSGLTS